MAKQPTTHRDRTPSMRVGCESFLLPSFVNYGCDEGTDVATSSLCDHIVPGILVSVYGESWTRFVGKT